jgi:hypothetical protein
MRKRIKKRQQFRLRPLSIAIRTVLRLLPLISLVAGLLIYGVRANAQSTPRPDPSAAQIKSDLKEILNQPEFHAESDQPGRLAAMMDSIQKRLERWWKNFQDFLDRLFPGGRGSIGAVDIHLVYAVILTLTIVALWLVVRVITQRGGLHLPKRRTIQGTPTTPTEEQETPLPPDEWIERAAKAAREGDFRAAFRAVFLAILVRLDRAGKIEFKKHRTNGEYVRSLRLTTPKSLYDLFVPLSNEFDLHWYGGRPSEESDYLRFLDAYRTLPVLIDSTPPVPPTEADAGPRSDRERS